MTTQLWALQSKDLELAYLECAPNYEVVRYVDVVSPHMRHGYPVAKEPFHFECDKQLEELLYARNDSIIDIALARIASPRMIAELLKRHKATAAAGIDRVAIDDLMYDCLLRYGVSGHAHQASDDYGKFHAAPLSTFWRRCTCRCESASRDYPAV